MPTAMVSSSQQLKRLVTTLVTLLEKTVGLWGQERGPRHFLDPFKCSARAIVDKNIAHTQGDNLKIKVVKKLFCLFPCERQLISSITSNISEVQLES